MKIKITSKLSVWVNGSRHDEGATIETDAATGKKLVDMNLAEAVKAPRKKKEPDDD